MTIMGMDSDQWKVATTEELQQYIVWSLCASLWAFQGLLISLPHCLHYQSPIHLCRMQSWGGAVWGRENQEQLQAIQGTIRHRAISPLAPDTSCSCFICMLLLFCGPLQAVGQQYRGVSPSRDNSTNSYDSTPTCPLLSAFIKERTFMALRI